VSLNRCLVRRPEADTLAAAIWRRHTPNSTASGRNMSSRNVRSMPFFVYLLLVLVQTS
jgi:hypothetical protein